MSTRRSRPELHAPDLSPPPNQSSGTPPRVAADDPRFAAAAQLETHDAYVRGVQEGRVRVVNPETVPPRPNDEDRTSSRRRSRETSLSTRVPEYVMHQLRLRYAETGITIRNQILIALRKEGFEVSDDDIQDERKRPRK
jgi:hypothetical protein